MTGLEVFALFIALIIGVASNAIYDAIKNVKDLLPIKSERKNAISKEWTGSFSQVGSESNEISYDISFSLRAKGKQIIGTGQYSENNYKVEVEVIGGFYRDDYLHLNYQNKNKAVFQHGLIILHWPNDPVTLKGKFVGIGRDSNQIVTGNVQLSA